jgi:hypothetical protein
MSKTDQWIGLTHAAESFVADLPQLDDKRRVEGPFGGIYNLCSWVWGRHTIQEIVQDTPWSSGPMYFTCLEILWDGRSEGSRILTWVLNPDIKNEVDYTQGHYWV